MLIVTLYSLHFRKVLKRKEDSAACWEITSVTITIAQSPTGDVIDIFVRTASRAWAEVVKT